MSSRRIVVTGMGAVTPFGVSVDSLWDGILESRCALSPITLFDTTDFDVHIGGEVPAFEPTRFLDRKAAKRMDRFAQLAMVACNEAVRASGWNPADGDPSRTAVVFGSGIGGLHELEEQFTRLMTKGPSKVSAFTIPRLMVNAASGNISIAHGVKGYSAAVSSACASAAHAMGDALRAIRHGDVDVVFTGGSEGALTPLALAAFASMKALSTRNDDPASASRPFDRDRDGFVLSEGAGALVFEEFEHARRRGVSIEAEVIGFGASSDALHIAQPSEDGAGAAAAMERALADAHTSPEAIDYINAHATGTPLGDLAETVAIKRVFGSAAEKLVVSSTKGATGHTLGASAGVEMIATIRAMQQSVVPPTINLDTPDDGCDLDYCPQVPRDRKLDIAMSNSFGFGGHNACLIVKRFQ